MCSSLWDEISWDFSWVKHYDEFFKQVYKKYLTQKYMSTFIAYLPKTSDTDLHA